MINSSKEENKEGCGLGLLISKKLTSALGGELSVDSRVGHGSTFTVALQVGSARVGKVSSSALDTLNSD